MAMALRLFAVLAPAGHALSWQPRTFLGTEDALNSSLLPSLMSDASEDGIGECVVPAGQVLFLHIMKAGGTSVDAFLACHCSRVGCSVMMSLGPWRDLHGNTNCKSSAVCTTHGAYKDRKELCGDDFENPRTIITAFREPVSRVFSLYNYELEQGHPLPPLAEVYEQCDAEQLSEKKPLGWLCAAMTNHMTLKTFANKENNYSAEMDEDALNQAKSLVANLNATFFMDDFDRFSTAFHQSEVITNTYTNPNDKRITCELGHSNPTSCPKCAAGPTPAEVALIEKHNEMDIALYTFAADLPNRQRGQ